MPPLPDGLNLWLGSDLGRYFQFLDLTALPEDLRRACKIHCSTPKSETSPELRCCESNIARLQLSFLMDTVQTLASLLVSHATSVPCIPSSHRTLMKASRLHASQLSGSRLATLCWFVRWPSTYCKDICSAHLGPKCLEEKVIYVVGWSRRRESADTSYQCSATIHQLKAISSDGSIISSSFLPKVGSKGRKLKRTGAFFKRRMAPWPRQFPF